MCFTSLITTINNNDDCVGKVGFKILINQIKKFHDVNNDGYALFFTNYKNVNVLIREMDFKNFIIKVKDNINKIINSKIIQLHLRNSTNIIKKEFIHNWLINNYVCAHNGIIHSKYENFKNVENDSLHFYLNNINYFDLNNLDKLKEVFEDMHGYGLFLLTNVKNHKFFVVAKNRKTKVQLINNNILLIASDNDIKYKDVVNISANCEIKKINVLGFEFDKVETMHFKFDVSDAKIHEILNLAVDDFILFADVENNVFRKVKLADKTISYYYNINSYYYNGRFD